MAVGSPFLRSLGLERHGLEWRWPEVDLAHPLDDGSAGVMLRSIEATAEALGADGAALAARVRRARAQRSTPSTTTSSRPVLHLPRHPLGLVRFGMPRRAAGDRPRARCGGAAGARAVRRRRRARVQPAQPADELRRRRGADLRRPPLRLAGRARAARARSPTRWPRCCAEHGGRIETGAPGALAGRAAARPTRSCSTSRPAGVAEIAGDRLPRARRPRLPPLPPRPGRVQGRPRGRGRRAVDERGLPPRGHGPRRRDVRGDRRRRARGQPRPDARAAVRARRPAVPGRPGALGRATSTRSGPTRTCRAATTATRPRRVLDQIERFAPGCASGSSRPRSAPPAELEAVQRELHRRRHRHRRQRPDPGPDPAAALRSIPTRPGSRGSTSAPPRRRRAAGCTGCAASTPPGPALTPPGRPFAPA